jgi:phage-related tail fiber protein
MKIMANTILIKRGNKADLSSLELLPGELGVALDTQELYVGDAEGNVKIVKGGASGAVESADKLTVPRNISISGDGTGSASFDGSKDVTISLALSDTAVTAGTYTKITVDSKGRVTKGENIAITDVTGLQDKISSIETSVSGKADKANSLAGYGITNAYTKTEVDGKVSDLTSQLGTANEAIEGLETSIEGKADKSTTLAGYGITDAYTKTQTDGFLAQKADTTAVNGKADKSTTLAGYGIEDAYTKTEVDAKVSSVYKYKGSVANEAALPQEDQVTGDVYNVEDTGMNVAWDGTKWDKLGSTVDLSAYMTTETANSTFATITTVNGKADKATSLSGYGITDAYTKTEADNAFMNSAEVESAITAKGYATTSAMNTALSSKANSADVYTKTVADSTFLKEIPAEYITETELSAELEGYAEKATTLAGYGITDAYTKTEVDNKLSGKLGTSDVIDGGTF